MKLIYKKIIFSILIAASITAFLAFDFYLWRLLSASAGIEAKMLCSGIFIANRTPESVLDNDMHDRVNYIRLQVDTNSQEVTATAFGVITKRAVFTKGIGCTLLPDKYESKYRALKVPDLRPQPSQSQELPWPTGEIMQDSIFVFQGDMPSLTRTVDKAFEEDDPAHVKNTRAIVIVHEGHLILERYAPGFSNNSPMLGYGLTKTVVNALVGILIKDGLVALDSPVNAPEWSNQSDSRQAITLGHLLRMSSCLNFDDSNAPLTDSVLMFNNPDMASYAAGKELVASPNTVFTYSNGSSNIIMRYIRTVLGGADEDYFSFPRRALFDKTGMRSAVIEVDATGTFVGSTYMFATARDWARLGMLFLQDGVWEEIRILPEGWVDYSVRPTETDPQLEYGAHLWTNQGKGRNGGTGSWPDLPTDTFFALGHDGQSITIIPSRDLVVVRLGLTRDQDAWDLNGFIADILSSLPAE